jgi:hypothetical protein
MQMGVRFNFLTLAARIRFQQLSRALWRHCVRRSLLALATKFAAVLQFTQPIKHYNGLDAEVTTVRSQQRRRRLRPSMPGCVDFTSASVAIKQFQQE